MLQLLFDQTRLPRTMKRDDWKAVDRWRRVTKKVLERHTSQLTVAYILYGNMMSERQRAEVLDKMINPPLLVLPDAGVSGMCLAPGQISYLRKGEIELRFQ
jgi:hypothetical protein